MQISQARVELLMKGFSIKTDQGYQGAAAPLADQLAMRISSSAMIEEYDFLAALPGMRELVDEVVIQNLRTLGFTIRNKEFESTIGLKVTDVLGDRLGLYSNLATMMGAAARNKPDELMAALMLAGFSTGLDYTGSAFFSANKQAYPGATQFTNLSTGQLNAARYGAVRTRLLSRLNAKGRPMGLGKDLMLIVSPKWEPVATTILNSEKIAYGAVFGADAVNNGSAEINNPYLKSARLTVWTQLAAAGMEDTWFLAERGSLIQPFMWQELQPLQYYSITNPEDSYVVTKKQFLYQGYSVMNVGYGFPELIEGSDGSVA